MKEPIAIQINDLHLHKENKDQILDVIKQLIDLCDELDIKNVFLAGDVFDSRTSQRLDVLITFFKILDLFKKNSIICYCIPGNHDKTRYDIRDSFLDTYFYHPSLILCDNYNYIDLIDGIRFHFIPFFKEEEYIKRFNPNFLENGKNVLITHMAITGSINNDGSKVESLLSIDTFKEFDRIFSGHYHNYQVIKNKYVHTPSIIQFNYGEDENKGFTIIYDDLTYEIRKAKFKEYKKIKINLDEIKKLELDNLIKDFSGSKDNIRFEILGSENKVKSLKKDKFFAAGIDIKTKIKEIDDNLIYTEKNEIVSYDNASLEKEFKEFCEENELNYKIGIKYLKSKFNG